MNGPPHLLVDMMALDDAFEDESCIISVSYNSSQSTAGERSRRNPSQSGCGYSQIST